MLIFHVIVLVKFFKLPEAHDDKFMLISRVGHHQTNNDLAMSRVRLFVRYNIVC